jgi:hypothetical protein
VHNPTERQCCRGVCQTSGTTSDVNAYRSEFQGIHTTLLAIKLLCDFHQIQSGSVTIACDCEKCITLSSASWRKVGTRTKHADLIRGIRHLTAELPVNIHFTHVDGHKDKILAWDALDIKEQLNVRMDEMAKDHVTHIHTHGLSCPSDIIGEGWQCWVNNTKQTSDPADAMRNHVLGSRLRAHLVKTNKMCAEDFDRVDWNAINLSLTKKSPLYHLWAAKHASRFCATGRMMERMKLWDNAHCPCCGHEMETTHHVIQCPDPRMRQQWEESVEGLEMWMDEVDTDPEINNCFSKVLCQADPTSFELECTDLPPSHPVRRAAEDQDKIGWFYFTEGKISKLWAEAQQAHYHTHHSRRSGQGWAGQLVDHLLALTHSQWTTRCDTLHEQDNNGLRMREGAELETAISNQFRLGLEGLHPRDHHFISRGHSQVTDMHGQEKKAWLSGILIARDTYEAHQTASSSDTGRMRRTMKTWLSN